MGVRIWGNLLEVFGNAGLQENKNDISAARIATQKSLILVIIILGISCISPQAINAEQHSSPWSAAQTIRSSVYGFSTSPSIAVDSKGVRHYLYGWFSKSGDPGRLTYKNSVGQKYTVAVGNNVNYNDIAVDSNDALHVLFRTDSGIIKYRKRSSSGSWSRSKKISGPVYGFSTSPSIAVDSKGVRHYLYGWFSKSGDPGRLTYKNSVGQKYTVAVGNNVNYNDIAVDSNDALHVLFRGSNGSVRYKTTIMLFVTVPGIKDHGKRMVDRAKFMARYSKNVPVVHIRESRRPSYAQITNKINKASALAKKYRKDVIVNVDMDLDNYNLWWDYWKSDSKWQKSVKWAGPRINRISGAFRKTNSIGPRRIYAHSAGVDAARKSVSLTDEQRFDKLDFFNGRTSVL